MIKVYVLSQSGQPLMPTNPAKARVLVKSKKALVVKRCPFTIKLNYDSTEYKQEVICGIDTGYINVGFSCRTEKEELICGTLKLDNNMSERLVMRKMYRRNRRGRLRYRKTRFLNRANARIAGKLMPSIQRRLDSHVRLVEKLKNLLPITKIIVEVANFDIQKIQNPEISGEEYQKGDLAGYENTKAYLIAREGNKCQLCKKESDKTGWHLHHIITRAKGGTNRPANLALLHHKCHDKLHKQKLFDKLGKAKQFKAETFMSIIRWKLVDKFKFTLPNIGISYGYETKIARNGLGLNKSHSNDAFVISGGTNQIRNQTFSVVQKRRNNRSIQLNRIGFKPSIRKRRYKYQPKDLVKINNKIFQVKGIHSYGKCIYLKDLTGKIINKKVADIGWHYSNNGLIFQSSFNK